jgi:hypothetical protein
MTTSGTFARWRFTRAPGFLPYVAHAGALFDDGAVRKVEVPGVPVLERLQAYGTSVSLVVLGLLVLADLALPGHIVVITSFSVAPLVAATLTTPRRTALVAVLAVAAAVAAAWSDHLGVADALTRVVMCAAISGFAVVIGKSRQRREKQLRRMTVIAETAQRAVLRAMPGEIGGVGFAVRYVSASEEALVGGDLYDFAATPHGVRLIVGDVRGKGIDAVQLAAAVLGAFRQSAFRRHKLVDVAADLDAVVARVGSDEDFVTALLAEFHEDGTLTVVNCGHHPPLLTAAGREPTLLDTGDPAPPLGMGPWPQPTHHPIPRGARLLFYTDGLVEARDDRGRFFPLGGFAAPLAVGELDTALDGLLQHLVEHTGKRLNDDVALVLTEQRGHGGVRASG